MAAAKKPASAKKSFSIIGAIKGVGSKFADGAKDISGSVVKSAKSVVKKGEKATVKLGKGLAKKMGVKK